MIWFFNFIIVFLIVFDRATRSYLNPYKTIGIFGKKGSGKTTLLTKMALQYKKKGWNVYSTIEIPGTTLFDIYQIGFFTFPPNSLILIDEIGMIFDNRNFKNFKPEYRDWFKYARQYRCKVVWFSQIYNDLDLKIRVLTDELWLAKSFMRVFSVRRRIIKSVGIKETADGSSTIDENYKFDSIFGGLKFTFIPRYAPFFKSFNPKPLPIINGEFFDFSDVQKRYISTKDFIFNNLKQLVVRVVAFFRARSLHARMKGKTND